MPTLHWIGKDKVINHHLEVPFRVLDHQYGFSDGERQASSETESGNKIIHGDNLVALKSLLPEYENKVKCIYIDPPYNTGNEGWVYNDNVSHPKIKKWLGDTVGKEGDDLSRHDKWLCMMYPRLKLMHKLLADDGALVISIGNQEICNLNLVLKEIFGNRQIAIVTIQTSGGKRSGSFNYQHEYMIFVLPTSFEPNPMIFTGGKTRSPYEGLTLATFNKVQRPNQAYPIFIDIKTGTLAGVGKSLRERIDQGVYTGELENFEYNYDEAPQGTVAIWPVTSKDNECVWRLSPARFLNDYNKGYIKISLNKRKSSRNSYSIQYLPEGVIKKIKSGKLKVSGRENIAPTLIFEENKTVGGEIPTIWKEKEFYSVKGTALLKEIFDSKVFNYPKPLELITEVLRALTAKNDIILDSFAGSAPTAHAVLNLNKQDGGNRKFILVEMEDYAEDITAERVKRVINGYQNTEGTGGAFDFYELGEPLFMDDGLLNEAVGLSRIRSYIWFSETGLSLQDMSHTKEYSYLLGEHEGTAYYFFYEPKQTTTLNFDSLSHIKAKAEQYIIYADNCLLPEDYLNSYNIIFKKIPRDITRF